MGGGGGGKAKQHNYSGRQSSFGIGADLLRAEAAAALARGVMGVEGEEEGGEVRIDKEQSDE